MKPLFTDEDQMLKVKRQLGEPRLRDDLKALADKALKNGPYTITDSGPVVEGRTPNDYYSQAPYWWPNPEDPHGPYIRRDGRFNPEIFLGHKMGLRHMCQDVYILANAGHYLGDSAYSAHAANLLSHWFIDEASKMNPHLEFGQAIPGICDGRGIGIIDTMYFIHMLQGVTLLSMNGVYDRLINGLKAWFEAYLKWMLTSPKGIDEKLNGNNHATWWTLQVASYAAFVSDDQAFDGAIDFYKNTLLPEQMSLDGSFPQEIARTRSYHYMMFNLHPCVLLCALASQRGLDLWHYQDDSGRGVIKALEFMMPYIEDPSAWPYGDIDPVNHERSCSTLLGAQALANERLIKVDHSFDPLCQAKLDLTDLFYPLYLLG